jgi:hypothetical protein
MKNYSISIVNREIQIEDTFWLHLTSGKNTKNSQVPVAHAYNPSYSRVRDQENGIAVQSQLWQIICETLFQKKKSQKRAHWVAEGIGPEFKPQYCKKRKQKIIIEEDT